MSKTFKDKRSVYGGPVKSKINSAEKILSRKFAKFKRFGPMEPSSSHCHYCGRLTEFDGGYLICEDCGGVDLAFNDLILDPVAA